MRQCRSTDRSTRPAHTRDAEQERLPAPAHFAPALFAPALAARGHASAEPACRLSIYSNGQQLNRRGPQTVSPAISLVAPRGADDRAVHSRRRTRLPRRAVGLTSERQVTTSVAPSRQAAVAAGSGLNRREAKIQEAISLKSGRPGAAVGRAANWRERSLSIGCHRFPQGSASLPPLQLPPATTRTHLHDSYCSAFFTEELSGDRRVYQANGKLSQL